MRARYPILLCIFITQSLFVLKARKYITFT